jgi:nitroreductase
MSGDTITPTALMSLFEAARWAPSCFNNQPWRFLYALRDTPHWPAFLDVLVPANQTWAQRAAVLVAVVSKTTMDRNGQPAPTHSFDAGAAWQNLALQGCLHGLVVHGMLGFDAEKATRVLAVPDDHHVEIMIAIGKPGDPADLPPNLRDRDVPSPRKALAEIAWEGPFR